MCDRHYIHMGKTTSNPFNIEGSGALCFLTPIQMARLTYMIVFLANRKTDQDRSYLKAGTSENSNGQFHHYSGSLNGRIVMDLVISKLAESVITSRDGGKIVEKANAESNVSDTAGFIFPCIQRTLKISGLNSILLSMTYTP